MCVLHLADYGGSYSGNFVASLRSLFEPCRALGLRVVLGFSDIVEGHPWVDELRQEGIPLHLLRKHAPLAQRSREVARLAELENASVIHTHFYRWDVPASLAAAGSSRIPRVVWHLHSPLPEVRRFGARAKDAMKHRVLGRRARVAAVSEAILREVVESGFPSARASYIPNGIDLARATTLHAGRTAVRRELGISDDAQMVLAFGWDPLRKGVDLALDAFASLAAGGDRRLVLTIVGPEGLEALFQGRFAGALPVWLRVLEPREHVADLYAAADIFLSASRAEGFPYALGEALAKGPPPPVRDKPGLGEAPANGSPVAVSDIPGGEWLRDSEGTRYFPPGDGAALAAAIADVADW